MKLEGF